MEIRTILLLLAFSASRLSVGGTRAKGSACLCFSKEADKKLLPTQSRRKIWLLFFCFCFKTSILIYCLCFTFILICQEKFDFIFQNIHWPRKRRHFLLVACQKYNFVIDGTWQIWSFAESNRPLLNGVTEQLKLMSFQSVQSVQVFDSFCFVFCYSTESRKRILTFLTSKGIS